MRPAKITATLAAGAVALVLPVVLLGCPTQRPSTGGDRPMDAGAAAVSAASSTSAATTTATTAKDAGAARPTANTEWEPHLGVGSVTARWVVLGTNLVDAKTGRRARAMPRGEVTFAADDEHFVVVGEQATTAGMASSEDDFRVEVGAAPDDVDAVLAPNGRAVLLPILDGRVFIIDTVKKTSTQVARPGDAGAPAPLTPRIWRRTSADGKFVTWVDGDFAYARDLDLATTRNWTVKGTQATSSEIGGDVIAALWGDELMIAQLSTGVEIARRKSVADFIVAADGKTIAWEDSAKPDSFVVFDVDKKKELGRASPAPTDKGVCGGGAFHLEELRGTQAALLRECSLIDRLRIDLVNGKTPPGVKRMESHTPAEDYEEEQAAEKVAKRAKIDFPGRPTRYGFLWTEGRKRIVLPFTADGGRRVAVFDAATGKRVCELAESEEQGYEEDLAVVPGGKTIAGIDGKDIGRLWDATTGKVLFEQKAK